MDVQDNCEFLERRLARTDVRQLRLGESFISTHITALSLHFGEAFHVIRSHSLMRFLFSIDYGFKKIVHLFHTVYFSHH